MQPTYFASFLLGEQRSTVSDALEVVGDWIFNNPHRGVTRPEDWPRLNAPALYPGGEKIQLLRLTDGDGETLQACALRFEHPDPQGRIWRTDCVISQADETEPAVRFAVTVSAGGATEREYAIRPPTSRPRIVRNMMDKFGGREKYPLAAKHLTIKTAEAEKFAGFILDPARTIPLVFVSRRNEDQATLCDLSDIVDKLIGIAYVCVADSSDLSWALTGHLSNRLNAYDGTIRVYWPRMTLNDAPHRHRWWNKRQLLDIDRRIADDLLRIVATASVTRHVSGLVRWEDVERENTRRTIARLQSSGASSGDVSDEWLKQYETDLAALALARQELEAISDALIERDEDVRRWKKMYLQALRDQSSAGDAEEALQETTIEDASGAITLAQTDFADRLEIIEARIWKQARLFEEPELLYAAFKWLATTYRDSKTGTRGCSDLDLSCREACEFRYNGHQSDITMSMFPDDYEITYDGEKVKLREHIGFGTSTEPRHTIRLAFFYHETSKRVVVGYVGQHQTTRRSN